MKKGWEIKKLGEVCDKASSNVSQNQLDNESGKYPIFGASGLIKNVSFYHQDKAYVSIVKDGAGIGRITLQPAYSSIIGTLQYLIPKREIDISYLYYFLLGVDFNKHRNGATIPHIYFKDYSQEKIGIPSLPEQKCIVEVLDKAFGEIAKAKKNTEENLRNTKEIFNSYLQSVFKNKGEGWEEKTVDKICEVEYGYTEKAKENGDYRFIRITDTDKDGLLIQENKMYINSFAEANKYILNGGDLLMARTGASAGNVLLFESKEKSVFASYLIRMNFKKEILSKLYWYYSKSNLYWNQVKQLSVGSAQPQFNGGALKQIVFPFPKSLKEQQSIVQKLDALSAETKKFEAIYQQKLNDLEELKKAILQKAFNGELVKE